jgi:hypothetical protein
MRKGILIAIVLAGALGFVVIGVGTVGAQELRVISEERVSGFVCLSPQSDSSSRRGKQSSLSSLS